MTGKEALIDLSKTCMAYQEEFGRLKIDERDNEALQALREIVQKYYKYKRAFEILKEKKWDGKEVITRSESGYRTRKLNKEEAELIEELMGNE